MFEFKNCIIQLRKQTVILLTMYFFLGLNLSIPSILIRYLFIETKSLGVSELSQITAVIALPWGFKVIFGFISDNISSRVGRHIQISLAYLFTALTWTLIGISCASSDYLYFLLFLSNACICFADVAQDAILVYFISFESRDDTGRLQSFAMAARGLGSLVGAYSSALISRHCIGFSVIAVTNVMPAFISLIYLSSIIKINTNTKDILSTCKEVIKTIKHKEKIYLILAIVFYSLTISDGPIIQIFFQRKQKLEPLQFAVAESFAFISIIFSSIFYNKFLRKISHVRVITITSIIMLLFPWLNIMYGRKVIEPDATTYLNITSLVGAFLGHISFLPLAVMAAKFSPKNIEATMYSFYMALFNLMNVISFSASAILLKTMNIRDYESINIWLYYMIDIFSDLVSIYLVQKFVRKSIQSQPQEAD